jgi:hypothetical protein
LSLEVGAWNLFGIWDLKFGFLDRLPKVQKFQYLLFPRQGGIDDGNSFS